MKKIYLKYKELIAYLFWGGMTTVISWGSYAVFSKCLERFFQTTVTITAANILSWICAVAFAFVTNKIWVFNSRSWKRSIWWPELGKFVSARIATGVFEIAGVPLLVKLGMNQRILGIEGMLSKVVISVLVIIMNYFFSKFFVFKNKK